MIPRLLIYGLAILAMAAGVFTQRNLQQPPEASARGDSPLDLNFSFFDLNGQLHHLDEWRGKVLIVNMWASWCPPCIQEMPGFVQLQKEYGDQGLQFVGLISGDTKEAAEAFLARYPVNYPVLNGEPGAAEWSAKLGHETDVLPLSAVFDQSGKLVHMEYGLFHREEVLKIVAPLLPKS